MLHRMEGGGPIRRTGGTERARKPTPVYKSALERRRTHRLIAAWHQAAPDATSIPSLAAIEAAADGELMRHTVLMRVGPGGILTIERFGPPEPITAAPKNGVADNAPVITPVVVTWVLSVGATALRCRTPTVESDEVAIGKRHLCYRCAVVPVSSDGSEIDFLVGILGYRWA